MFVVHYRKIFFAISAALVTLSIGAVIAFGLPFGIDFTGGALTEVTYTDARPEKALLENQITNLGLGGISLREIGVDGYLLRTRDLTDTEHRAVLQIMSQDNSLAMTEERFTSVGPVIGEELRNKALIAVVLVVLAIILYVAFAFRGVAASRGNQGTSPSTSPAAGQGQSPSSWKYGLIAIIALIHDIIIPIGLFSWLGYTIGAEIDVLFVMAILAILGYSVNDTIVVFDRVRDSLEENKEFNKKEDFEITVGKSLKQTFMRSINTSLTTILALLALFFVGPESTENFALVLITGIIAGTYSSLFVATPLLVTWAGKDSK